MPVLHEPLPAAVRAELRSAVLGVRAVGRCRRDLPTLRLGRPAGASVSLAVSGAGFDHGLRRDVVATLLQQCEVASPPLTWLTRPGELVQHDLDAAWLSAAWAAHAEAGVPLTMVVVTQQGWWDPRSDLRQTWRRLRARSGT